MIGVILAGGKSSRFGEDKALYPLNGLPMYEHVEQSLENVQAIDEIVINTNDKLKTRFKNYRMIVDDAAYQEHGPLGTRPYFPFRPSCCENKQAASVIGRQIISAKQITTNGRHGMVMLLPKGGAEANAQIGNPCIVTNRI